MVLTNDRTKLDDSLQGNDSICVLRGDMQSNAAKVHACMELNWHPQPWQKWFQVTDDSLLTAAEISDWYNDDPAIDYVFLGRTTNDVTSMGDCENELLNNSACDFLVYLAKFGEADQQ